jgi:DNA-binding transcriptional MerR regulator
MLTIGRFADATGLTVRALRHYDEIGLLVPDHVDPQNGYRHYAEAQVADAVTIRRLRALELPLDEIAVLLHADADGFRAGLAAHGYRVAEEASDKHMLLIELAALVEGGDSPVAIELRDEPELRLAAVIRQVSQDEVGAASERAFRTVHEWLRDRGAKPTGSPTSLFRSGDREGWHLLEAGWPVDPAVEGDETVAVHTYPAAVAASHEYRGPFEEMHPVAQRFIATVLGRGLRFDQPIRIVYIEEEHARLVWPLAHEPRPIHSSPPS